MIRAKTPIVNTPDAIKSVKYYTVANKIIPIRRISSDMIPRLEEPINNEVELTKKDIKRIVVERKKNNPLNKFFRRALKYINRLDDFINKMKSLKLKTIAQKRILLETDKSDQKIREYQAKRIVKENQQEDEQQKDQEVDLKVVGGILAAALGLGVISAGSAIAGGAEIYGDVVSQGEFAVDSGGEQTQRIPAWIPFPKGTTGLTFTSGFGYQNWRGYEHGGIDIAGAVGTPIITPMTGVVEASGWNDGGYGNWVIVKSGSTEMIFGHMYQTPPVRAGQQIQAGTVVGGIGSTGRSTGPHLHWTITVDGKKVDPALWTQSNKPQTSTAGARPNNRPPLDLESEGGINSNKKIMVGEAGTEFVVPLSQMPLFMQGMMEEKIKCLNPFYTPQKTFGDIGIKSSFGKTNKKFASGAITGGSPEFWKIVALTSREDTLHPQGQADVAQSLYNRSVIGSYPGGKNISSIITAGGQYQPTFDDPGAWSSIKDRKSAITAAGKGSELVDMAAKSITNPLLQREAARFVGGRTDFMGESQKPFMKPGDITRGKNYNFHGWFYDARLPKAAPIASSVKSMTKQILKPSSAPKVKQENWFDKFIKLLTTSPDGKSIIKPQKKASLTDIDESNQMEVAKLYQNQFELNTDNVNQIIPLQVRVHYSETA